MRALASGIVAVGFVAQATLAHAGALTFCPSGHVFVSYDGSVEEWDPQAGRLVGSIAWPSRPITRLGCGPDGKLLLGVDDRGKLVLWDLEQRRTALTIDTLDPGRVAKAFAVSPDGRVIAAGGDMNVLLLDVASGQAVHTLDLGRSGNASASQPTDIRFSPDGKTIAVAASSIYFFNAAGQPLDDPRDESRQAAAHHTAEAVAWTPDGRRLVTAGGHLLLVDPSVQKVIGDLDHGHGSYNHHLVVTADGKWVGMSENDGLGWYQLPSLTHKASWKVDKIGAMALSPDGKLLVVDTSDGPDGRPAIQVLDAGADKLTVLRTLATFASSPSANAPVATAAAPPKGSEKLIHDVAYAAEVILLESNLTTKDETAAHAKTCSAAVAAALAARVPPETELKVDNTKRQIVGSRPHPDGLGIILSLANVRDHICSAGTLASIVDDVGTKASASAVWIGKIQHVDPGREPSTSMLEYAVTTGAACKKAVAEARAAGVTDQTPVEFFKYESDLTSPLPLGEIDGKICAVVTALGTKVVAERAAAEKKEYEPYLKVLSGDKAKMFWDKRMLGGDNWYGHGGRRLTKPADFATSDVWYYYVVNRNGLIPSWEVEGWTFSGSKRTGVYDKTGSGDTPPSSAFR